MFVSAFFPITDLREVSKVMISKAILVRKPWNAVSIDLKPILVQLLCLSTLNANHFSSETTYFDDEE